MALFSVTAWDRAAAAAVEMHSLRGCFRISDTGPFLKFFSGLLFIVFSGGNLLEEHVKQFDNPAGLAAPDSIQYDQWDTGRNQWKE